MGFPYKLEDAKILAKELRKKKNLQYVVIKVYAGYMPMSGISAFLNGEKIVWKTEEV
jgi:hypothetical protein